MARALSQILAELDNVYRPQRDLYNQQINTLDPQLQAEEQGLQAQKQDSFNQIQQGANRRGLNFSGIPLQEQAQYTGQSYLPAVANLKAKYAQQRFNLQDAIAKIQSEQYMKGQDIYQTELDRDAAAEAARSAGGGSGGGGGGLDFGGFGGGGGGAPAAARAGGRPQIQQRAGGGFNFQDAQGRGISAARYAQLANIPFRTLLSQMAKAGDSGAKYALSAVGDDFGYNRGKVSNQTQANILKALGINAAYNAPTKPASQAQRASGVSGVTSLRRAFGGL